GMEAGPMVQFMAMFWGPVLATLALVIWWMFGSRLRWTDRWLGVLGCAAAWAVVWPLYHASFGLMGIPMYALPIVTTAWVLWLLVTPMLRWPIRRVGLFVVFLLAWRYFGLIRFEGINGDFAATFQYRWNPTAEQKFQAERAAWQAKADRQTDVSAAQPLSLQPGDWPGFRGPA